MNTPAKIIAAICGLFAMACMAHAAPASLPATKSGAAPVIITENSAFYEAHGAGGRAAGGRDLRLSPVGTG